MNSSIPVGTSIPVAALSSHQKYNLSLYLHLLKFLGVVVLSLEGIPVAFLHNPILV